jgi:AAA domain
MGRDIYRRRAQVQTIDQSQGDEADAVVLSLVLAYTLPAPSRATSSGVSAGIMQLSAAVSSRWSSEVAPTDYVQLQNRANVAISRARYHLTVLASEAAHFSMKSRGGGRQLSLWGAVLDTTAGGAAVFDGSESVPLGGRWLHAHEVRLFSCRLYGTLPMSRGL